MRKTAFLLGFLTLTAMVFGCNGKGGNQPAQGNKAEGKADQPGAAVGKDLAFKFLQGVQTGDKVKMFEATNLTTNIVNESREKLIHPAKYKQTDLQRKESEHALRISGEIDFFVVKIRRMLPQSASFEITKTTTQSSTADTNNSVHNVEIIYGKKEEAMIDKTGKPIKKMVVRLQQITRSVNGRSIHEFSFDSKDFERIAAKDFEVMSYY